MDVDHPERGHRWDDGARAETETGRLERNWFSLLQELRIAQTGLQRTGFLPTLPFQQRFDRLDDAMRGVYAATVACAVAATGALSPQSPSTGRSFSIGARRWIRPGTGRGPRRDTGRGR